MTALVALIAVPLELYILVELLGAIETVSTPPAVPVTVRKNRITVSPPDRAPALPSDVLLFFLILLITVLVATPPLRAKVRAKSLVSKAPLPPLVLYAPALSVTSA